MLLRSHQIALFPIAATPACKGIQVPSKREQPRLATRGDVASRRLVGGDKIPSVAAAMVHQVAVARRVP